ncbi:MAG: MarR family winged helix-turn-helix transcriptional regulator [Steroidobacteraceae bacterium]
MHIDNMVANSSAAQLQADVEMSAQERRAIVNLAKNESALMTQLAKSLAIPVSTTTHVVGRLVDKGLAARLHLEEDRRAVQVQLSTRGKKVAQALWGARMAFARDMLVPLNPAERDKLLELMAKMAQPTAMVSNPAK